MCSRRFDVQLITVDVSYTNDSFVAGFQLQVVSQRSDAEAMFEDLESETSEIGVMHVREVGHSVLALLDDNHV